MEEIIPERIPEQTQKQAIANLASMELSITDLEILYYLIKLSPKDGLFYAGQLYAQKIFPQFATKDDNIWRSILQNLPANTIKKEIDAYLKKQYSHNFESVRHKVPGNFLRSALLSLSCRAKYRILGALLKLNLKKVYRDLYPFSGTMDYKSLVEMIIYACLITAPNTGSLSDDEANAIKTIKIYSQISNLLVLQTK